MKKHFWLLALSCAFGSAAFSQSLGAGDTVFLTLRPECRESGPIAHHLETLIKEEMAEQKDETTIAVTLKVATKAETLHELRLQSRCLLEVPGPESLAPFQIPQSEKLPAPNFEIPGFLNGAAAFFNDPLYKKQTFLRTIEAESAYRILLADAEFLRTPVRIGVIDEGAANDLHEDLQGIIATGSDIGRSNVKHGQYVLGIMAAQSGNNKGTVGASPFNTVFTYRALNYVNGKVNSAHLANTIREFGRLGMDAVNLSLAINRPCTRRTPDTECYHPIVADPTIRRAIQETSKTYGTVFVLSASNEGQKVPRYVTPDDGILVVGNSTSGGKIASYSNHGAGVDLFVPENGVYGLTKEGYSSSLSGTSFAAPVVAATAALTRHYLISHGIAATAGQVARHILRFATVRRDLARNESSGLELNMGKAVSSTQKIESFRR